MALRAWKTGASRMEDVIWRMYDVIHGTVVEAFFEKNEYVGTVLAYSFLTSETLVAGGCDSFAVVFE